MTTLAYLPGSALRRGYIVRSQGFRWIVQTVQYELTGNMGTKHKPHPRYCVDAIPADDKTRRLPSTYHQMTMGLCTSMDWCVEVE